MLRSLKIKNTILLIAASVVFGSCNRNPFFGNEAIPPSQWMHTAIDSSITFSTYPIAIDSLLGSNVSTSYYLGRVISPYTGEVSATFFSNYRPNGFDDKTGFGAGGRIDSLILDMTLNYVEGDTSQNTTIEVYRIKDYQFYYHKLYFTNFDITPYLEEKPLITFETKSGGKVWKHLPKDFADFHFDPATNESHVFYSEERFHERFKGLYFKAIPHSMSPGTLFSVGLSAATMRLYYNNTANIEKHKDDTPVALMQYLNFDDNQTHVNTAVAMISHDYSKADPSVGGINAADINNPNTAPSTTCIVSGPVGLGSKIVINQNDITKIIDKAQSLGYTTIGIHKAEIVWEKIDKSWQSMDSSLAELGLYINIDKGKFILDYDLEKKAADIGYETTLGGLLNRSKGVYIQDITRQMQAWVAGRSTDFTLELYPGSNSLLSNLYTIIAGSASTTAQPKVIITYTMVK